MQFNDFVPLAGARTTADGFLVTDARVARTGIQVYRGAEVGKPHLDEVRVYRPPEEVFSRDAVATYAHRPVTLNHPDELVGPKNWRDVAVGQTGDEVVRDGEFIRVPLVLMDAAAIEAVSNGSDQLSMGYTARLDWTDGETPEGEPFQAVQRDLRMNHLAVVAAARGGSDLKIGDDEGVENMAGENRSIMVDGVPVSLPDQSAAIVEKALKDADSRVETAEAKATKVADDMKAATEAHDAAIAKKDAEIDNLKSKVVDADDLDKKVAERAALVDSARKIVADIDVTGKSDKDVKRAVVVAKFGDAMKDKADAYIEARFDILTDEAEATVDGIGAAVAAVAPAGGADPRDTAYAKKVVGLRDAHRNSGKEGAA